MASVSEKTIGGERFAELLQKIEQVKKDKPLDLSAAEDLSIAIMNLISLEEHFFFTGAKVGDTKYHDLSGEVRELRKHLMRRLIPPEKYEGETWCVTKHLLSAIIRLIEVGGKYRSDGNKKASDQILENAYRLYSIFWALKLDLVSAHRLREEARAAKREETMALEDLIARLANCCEE